MKMNNLKGFVDRINRIKSNRTRSPRVVNHADFSIILKYSRGLLP